jgi:hypothetical protein
MNKCPHPDCKAMKPRNKYACTFHWTGLPILIRNEITKAYQTSAAKWLAAHNKAMKHWSR